MASFAGKHRGQSAFCRSEGEGIATKISSRQAEESIRVTVPEMITGPLAGAVLGYGVFAILAVAVGVLFAGDNLSIPAEDWKDLSLGASVLTGLLLFIGYLYGGFIAGRAGGAGQRGVLLGGGVFLAGVALALAAGWAVTAGTTGDQTDRLTRSLRILGTPGNASDWQDIGTTAGVSSVAGMLVGSLAGGVIAERRADKVHTPRNRRKR